MNEDLGSLTVDERHGEAKCGAVALCAPSLSSSTVSAPKIALVHEWLTSYAGSERVVEQLIRSFADAPLHAICDFLPPESRGFLQGREVQTSFVQKLPLARRTFRHLLPLLTLAVEQFDLSAYDLVISSNHAVAKGVITGPDQLHISYVHTPMRYAWDLQSQYLSESGLNHGIKGILARALLHYLRLWDQSSSARVDVFVANSRYIARRIEKCYRRKAHVIHPPVDTSSFDLCTEKDDFYLTASRMVPYKRLDIIVQAFAKLPRRKLVVIGDGPDMARLRAMAGPNVEFLGHQSHDVLRDHMRRAKAFLFAAEEDFGITPVEAQACGTPVIAFGRGGATETVVDGETGLFFHKQSPEAVAAAVHRFEEQAGHFSPARIRIQAERFSAERFRRKFTSLTERAWMRFEQRRRVGRSSGARPSVPR
jgi:glycosyltransferase involved in cell wall biosynthesis